MWGFELLVIALMILFNSVFAGYEIALASISQSRLEALAREKRRGAKAALRMKERIEASLAVVQLGITLVGATAAATGGAGAEESIEPMLLEAGISPTISRVLAIVLIVAPLTFVTILVGELIPKVFSLRNKEWVCLKLSGPMEWFSYPVWPAVWVLENSVNAIMNWSDLRRRDSQDGSEQGAIEELHGAAAMARIARLIGHHEENIIVSASQLASTPVRRIMLPSEYIGMLTVDQSLSEALVSAHQEMHTRFPVTEVAGDPQRIVGYVNFKDIVAALRFFPRNPVLRDLVRNIRSFRDEDSVADALGTLMRERNHIALVKNARDEVVGMITLEDVVEELVGEIHDEFDRMPTFLNAAGQGWIAGGFVSLAKILEETGIELELPEQKPIYTLSDWIVEQLDRPPRGGDLIQRNGVQVMVRKVRHVLVQEAYLQKIEDREDKVTNGEDLETNDSDATVRADAE